MAPVAPDDRNQAPLSEMNDDEIYLRGRSLAGELIGGFSFSETLLLQLRGDPPSSAEARVVDAILVALMEHGLTPSALAARLIYDAAPEALQGAVAGGLLASGSRFLGAMRDAALLTQEIVADTSGDVADAAMRAASSAFDRGVRLPGFGHNLHSRSDPRVQALFDVARREGVYDAHCAAQEALIDAVRTLRPRLPANAAGSVGAIVLDLGLTPDDARGFALVARSAGLIAHVHDEAIRPVARALWEGTFK